MTRPSTRRDGRRVIAGTVIWVTGLPASGKTTLARLLVESLRRRGLACLWLDSDDLRGFLATPGEFTDEGRAAFYRALAHIARLGAEGGAAVVISATGSRRAFRDDLRAVVPRFVEVWLRCDTDVLRQRDAKGLYRRADAGEIANLPGVGALYEPPEKAEVVLDSAALSVGRMVETVLEVLGISSGP